MTLGQIKVKKRYTLTDSIRVVSPKINSFMNEQSMTESSDLKSDFVRDIFQDRIIKSVGIFL